MGGLWTSGGILSAAAAWVCFTQIPAEAWQWRSYVLLSAAPSVLLLALFPWLVESPRFDLAHGHEDRALKTLRLVDGANAKARALWAPRAEGHSAPPLALPANLRLLRGAQGTKPSPTLGTRLGSWVGLFRAPHTYTTLPLCALWFLNMGAYFGICFVTPLYFKAMNDNAYLAAFISSCSEVPGIIAAAFLVSHTPSLSLSFLHTLSFLSIDCVTSIYPLTLCTRACVCVCVCLTVGG